MRHLRKLLDLDAKGCRWPVTTDTEGHHLFCNEPQRENSSYCVGHHQRAYTAPVTRPVAGRATS